MPSLPALDGATTEKMSQLYISKIISGNNMFEDDHGHGLTRRGILSERLHSKSCIGIYRQSRTYLLSFSCFNRDVPALSGICLIEDDCQSVDGAIKVKSRKCHCMCLPCAMC
jgi:hypothetical protein